MAKRTGGAKQATTTKAERNKGGRPTKLTPETHKAIVDMVKAGCYAETAARQAGIDPATYYRWMADGDKQTTGIYHEFRESVKNAEAHGEAYAVLQVRSQMAGDWKAAMTYLERKFPERWGRRGTSIAATASMPLPQGGDPVTFTLVLDGDRGEREL